LQISNIKEIKKRLVELWRAINAAFDRCDFRVSPGNVETLRWENKQSFDSKTSAASLPQTARIG